MVLPILAALGITEAVWIAVLGAIRLISWITGIVFVTSYVRDTVTGAIEGQEQASQDQTIEQILARTDLTAEQKKQLIDAYLATQAGKTGMNWQQTLLLAVGILAAAYIASNYIGGKK